MSSKSWLLIFVFVLTQKVVAQRLDNSYWYEVYGTPQYVSAVEASDGGILLFGNIDYYGSTPTASMIKINRLGKIDTTFKKVYANQPVQIARVLPDGKLLICGNFTAVNGVSCPGLVRLFPDGTLDPTFKFQSGMSVWDVRIQADGKILVNHFLENTIKRYTADGAFDPTFNIHITIAAAALFPTPLGIVVADPESNFYRLNYDGSLDSRFANAFPDANQYNSYNILYLLAAQEDGKVVVGYQDGVYRVNTDGSVDWSYQFVDNQARSATIRKNGRILVAGSGAGVELNADGTLYQHIAFSPNLIYSYKTMNVTPYLELYDQHILVSGATLRVVNPDISIDENFPVTQVSSAPNYFFNDIQFDFQGRALISIGNLFSPGFSSEFFRVGYNGKRDSTFYAPPLWSNSMALEEDNKIFVTGGLNNPLASVSRLNTDGTIDSTFYSPSTPGFISKIRYNGANIIVGGRFSAYDNTVVNAMVKLDKSGKVVGTYAIPEGQEVTDFDLQSDGSVVAICSGTSPPRLYRFSPDCYLDTSFPGSVFKLYSDVHMKIDSKNRIYLVGVGVPNRIMRLSASGTIDDTFKAGTFDSEFPNLKAIDILPDGSIAIGGSFGSYQGQPTGGLVIIKEDGSFVIPTPLTDPSTSLLWVKYAAGNLYVGGRISMNNGRKLGAIARFLFDGAYVPKPPDPVNLNGRIANKANLQLGWVYTSGAEDGFILERSTNGGNSFDERAKLYRKTFAFIDDEIDTTKTYYYRIHAFNTTGSSGYSNTFKFPADVITRAETPFTAVAFPNPTHGLITITTNTPYSKVEVFNILGQSVTPMDVIWGEHSVSINLASLPNGVYSVILTSSQSTLRTTKVVKY